MSTKADFFVGTGNKAQWLGGIGWDGYPEGIDKDVLQSRTEEEFKENVKRLLASREDAITPESGESWGWKSSNRVIDYAYCFLKNKVQASEFGSILFDPLA